MGGGDEADEATTPALHVIVLGSGGGPQESNTTAFLVRSLASGWRKGSVVAVDAGVHLSAITRILEQTQPPDLGTTDALALPYTLASGPFAGLEVRSSSPAANAAYIHRNLIDTYLITHPHLDHISGFVINTAGLPGSRVKRLAGLPSTIAAFKTHIFNNVIWPNLSDENNGAGMVTYMRLVEGGSPALGDGDGKGYLEISDGLGIKVWGVSHGHCIEKHSHRGSASSTRYSSVDGSSMTMSAMSGMSGMSSMSGLPMPMLSPRALAHHNAANPNLSIFLQQQQSQRDLVQQQQPATQVVPGSSAPSGPGRTSSIPGQHSPGDHSVCVYDSSAYFIRDVTTGREVLIFGDVEPDSISLSPRNHHIWQEAAPKIATGKLAAVFVECSYDDSQSVDRLFGHLTPRFIIEELSVLASEVEGWRGVLGGQVKDKDADKKRKREGSETGNMVLSRRKTMTQTQSSRPDDPVSPKTTRPSRGSGPAVPDEPILESPHIATPTAELSLLDAELAPADASMTGASAAASPPLRGLKVVIIHMKDKLNDGPQIGEIILEELLEHEKETQLGCEFVISYVGQSLYL